MGSVTVYLTDWCPYCRAARDLLRSKGVQFTEIVASSREVRAEMVERANGVRTVPQIFIGDTHIGGYEDMRALDLAGKLDEMLTA